MFIKIKMTAWQKSSAQRSTALLCHEETKVVGLGLPPLTNEKEAWL